MAKVWFVKRRGSQWIAPGGSPVDKRPLASLVFPLDIGTHRKLSQDVVTPEPSLPPGDVTQMQRVFVEVTEEDLRNGEFSGYQVGFYDSPFSPSEVKRRLENRPA